MSTQEATGLFPAPARLVGERTDKRIHTFRYAGIKSAALTVAGSEHLGLPESLPPIGHRQCVHEVVRAVEAPVSPASMSVARAQMRLAVVAGPLRAALPWCLLANARLFACDERRVRRGGEWS